MAAGEPAGGQPSIAVVERLMRSEGRTEGLAPFYVDPSNGALGGGIVTLGARGDSYYEYMLKQWLLSGKQQQSFLRWRAAQPVMLSLPGPDLSELADAKCQCSRKSGRSQSRDWRKSIDRHD